MSRQEAELTRRDFIIYYLSPMLTAVGVGFAGIGIWGSREAQIEAEKDVARMIKEMEIKIESQCGKVQSEVEKEKCLQDGRGIITNSRPYFEKRQWYEHGGSSKEELAKWGLGSLGLGVAIKLVDTFLQRRAANVLRK